WGSGSAAGAAGSGSGSGDAGASGAGSVSGASAASPSGAGVSVASSSVGLPDALSCGSVIRVVSLLGARRGWGTAQAAVYPTSGVADGRNEETRESGDHRLEPEDGQHRPDAGHLGEQPADCHGERHRPEDEREPEADDPAQHLG